MQALFNTLQQRVRRPDPPNVDQPGFWQKDSETKACYECAREFNLFVRKHHCRMCGGIHCDRCSNNFLPPSAVPHMQATTPQRCCNRCARNYEQEHGLQEGSHSGSRSGGSMFRLDPLRGTKPAPVPQRRSQLQRLERPLAGPLRSTRTLSSQDSLPARVHPDARSPVGTPAKRGSTGAPRPPGPLGTSGDAVAYTSPSKPYSDNGSQTPQTARNHDKALIWEEPPAMPLDFGADHLSQPQPPQEPPPGEPPSAARRLQWFDSQLSGAGVPAVGFADSPPVSVAQDGRSRVQDSTALPVALDVRRGMSRVACDHLRRVISQLLTVEQISSADVWLPVVHRLAVECAMLLSPTALEKHGTLDPRAYVKVKKVPDASTPAASRVVQGVVFTKNLTHRAMRSEIRNPRVLLLQGALEYHRQNRLLTLDTLIPQEDEFVHASVAKARRFEPNLILVEKSVARRAQEMLLKANVSLGINVKSSTLERIARCAKAPVASHLDDLSPANIVQCQSFHMEDFVARQPPPPPATRGHSRTHSHTHIRRSHIAPKRKTLIYLEGFSDRLGCTIVLRGAPEAELFRIKRVMQFALYAAYCARLEVAYLADVATVLGYTVTPCLQRRARGEGRAGRGAEDGADATESEASTSVRAPAQLPALMRTTAPPPLANGRVCGTWEEWGCSIGDSCRVAERPIVSISPYVRKWVSGTSGDTPAPSGSPVTDASVKGDDGETEIQALARVYYDHVTQVSYSYRNFTQQQLCEAPEVQKHSHYGRRDRTLHKFLLACMPTRCASCGEFSMAHAQQFVHGGQCLSVSVYYVPRSRQRNTHDNSVWLWVRVRGRPDISKQECARVRLSSSSQCLSFAHWLELMCSVTSLTVDGASLNRNVVLFFKVKGFIVCLNPNRFKLYEMVIPTQPVRSDVDAYSRTIQHDAVSLMMEVTGTFEKLEQQMMRLRVLASDEEPNAAGKPAGGASMRNSRSRSATPGQTLPDTEPSLAQPVQRKRQVELLLDQWYRRMEDDLGELMDAVREVSTTVGAASEAEVHTAVLDARLAGTSAIPLQAQRLLSLHIRLITLRCRYSDVFHFWSEQIIALGRVIQDRGQVAASAGVHAALTDAGLHDSQGTSEATATPSHLEEASTIVLSSGQRLASHDIEAAVSALLASHHSTARPLDSSPMPLTVSVTLHVVRVTIDEPHSRMPAVQEYVQVFIHPLERTVSRGGYELWTSSTPSRASPLLSAFDTVTAASGSTVDSGERRPRSFSPRRIESNGSGAMPVVSLRAGMGPDLRHLASTPVPGERTDAASTGSPPQSGSPRQANSSSPPSSQRSPVAGTPAAKTSQRSPLALHTVSGSTIEPYSGGGGSSFDSPAAAQPMPKSVSFHDTLHHASGGLANSAGGLQRSSSQRSDASTHTEGTVIVHEGSVNAATGGVDAVEGEASTLRPEPTFAVDDDYDEMDPGSKKAAQQEAAERSSQDAVQGSRVLGSEPTLAIRRGSDDWPSSRELRPEPSLAAGRAMPPSPFESIDDDAPGEGFTQSPTSMHTHSVDAQTPMTPVTPDNASLSRSTSPGPAPRRCHSTGALLALGRRTRSPAVSRAVRTAHKPREGRLSDGGGVALAMGLAGPTAKRQLQFGSSFAGFPNAGRTPQDWPAWTWTAAGTATRPENGPEATADALSTDCTTPPVAIPTLQPHIAMSSVFAGSTGAQAPRGIPHCAESAAVAAVIPPSSEAELSSGAKSRLGPRSSTHSSASSLSHKSARPVGPMPAMHPEPHESESPSLRRSMSTGDEHELREAVRPSLLDWGVPESNIDWIVSKLNIDRRIDRTDTHDKILDGLWGWYTNLAGDQREQAGQDEAQPPLKPLLRSQTTVSEAVEGEDTNTQARGESLAAAEERAAAATLAKEASATPLDTLPEAPRAMECAVEEAAPVAPQPLLHRVFGSGALESSARAGSRGLVSPFATSATAQSLPIGHHSNLGVAGTPALPPGTSADSTAMPLPPLMERPSTSALPPSASLPAKVMMHSRAVSMVGATSDRPAAMTQPMLKFCIIPSEGIAGINIPVFPEEPTSTVAFFLTSPAYHEQLDRMRADHRATTSGPPVDCPVGTHTHTSSRSDLAVGTPRSSVADAGTPPCHSPSRSTTVDLGADGSFALDTSKAGYAAAPGEVRATGAGTAAASSVAGGSGDGVEAEAGKAGPCDDLSMLRSSVKKSLTLEFTAASQPNTSSDRPMRFTVVAYYALQFAELRKRLVAGGELSFLLSLSRCKRWRPKGGKTMAYFAKTFDERYIIKSLSRSEKASFLEFAPHYFQHISNMLEANHPSCLSKVLGFFQLSVRSEWQIDVVVTENVFYDKQLARRFDLKGTGRSVGRGGPPDVKDATNVLLDDQLKQSIFFRPLIVPPDDRQKLIQALMSDTAFLSSVGVMDYSLLLGIDRNNQRLIVGIIDYIRQYTWDKQVEHWVKSSGIMPGPKKEPVVISPKQYMKRFRRAMESYFMVVPFANKLTDDARASLSS
eukprot:jgi/Ulvmu1/8970/UM005_0061.1